MMLERACVLYAAWDIVDNDDAMRFDSAQESRVVVFRDVCVHQATTLVSTARRRLHRHWRGTARCSIWMSAVSIAVMLECVRRVRRVWCVDDDAM